MRIGKFVRRPDLWLLVLGFGLLLALNWPGQMSYDSVMQLADGRSGYYDTWHPPVMAWLLGLFDRLLPGPGVYLVVTSALLLAAWLVLQGLGRPRGPAAILLILIFSTPQLLLYQGTIWKDVLFADAGIAAFVCLAAAGHYWSLLAGRYVRARYVWLGLAAVLFGLAALARQNGFLLLPIAAVCVGVIAVRQKSPSAWRHGAGLFLASVVVWALSNFALSFNGDGGQGADAQLRLAQTYDLVGAVRAEPQLRLSVLEQRAPALDRAIRNPGAALYSPHLVDTLETSTPLIAAIGSAPRGAIFAQWWALVMGHPGLYLRERWPVFRWVLAPPDLMVCHPDVVGVDGPPDVLKALQLHPGIRAQDRFLYFYVARFFGSPVLYHPFFAALALLLLVVLARRGTPEDIAIAGLQVGALAFALSFFIVSIACDYRYLYFLDLAAMTGALRFFALPIGVSARPEEKPLTSLK